MFKLNGKENELYTKKEILELQENETITLEIDKRVATLIGFALDTEIESYEKTIQELQKQENTTKEQEKFCQDTISTMYDTYQELSKIKDMLKQYYGILQD